MNRSVELTDDQLAVLKAVAARSGQTPQLLVDQWIKALDERQRAIYYSTDEMFEALDAFAARADSEQTSHEESQAERRE